MNIIIHNKDKTVIKQTDNSQQAVKMIKQLTNVFNERFYISLDDDVWAMNNYR
jgi:hypothetical protein